MHRCPPALYRRSPDDPPRTISILSLPLGVLAGLAAVICFPSAAGLAQQQTEIPTKQVPDAPAVLAKWEGIVISEFVSRPNSAVGVVAGEFIELYNRNDPVATDPIDVSGWTLALDSGMLVSLPNNTEIAGQQYLVIDLAGGEVASRIPAEANAVIVTTWYDNDYFEHAGESGMSDMLVLARTNGSIVDAVLWSNTPTALPNGPLVQSALGHDDWPPGAYVPNSFDPALGDIGFGRREVTDADSDGPAQWAEGNVIGPTPGMRAHLQPVQGSLVGRIVDPRGVAIPGASVTIPAQNLSATSDAAGFYILPEAPPGDFDVHCSKIGFVSTWEAVEGRRPFEVLSHDFVLQPINASTTATSTVGPKGATIQDPGGRFIITIPAGFLTTDVQVTATWLPPGLQPYVLGPLLVR